MVDRGRSSFCLSDVSLPHSFYTLGTDERSSRYFKASSYSLWGIVLLLILARPPLAFFEQYWLRRKSYLIPTREDTDACV